MWRGVWGAVCQLSDSSGTEPSRFVKAVEDAQRQVWNSQSQMYKPLMREGKAEQSLSVEHLFHVSIQSHPNFGIMVSLSCNCLSNHPLNDFSCKVKRERRALNLEGWDKINSWKLWKSFVAPAFFFSVKWWQSRSSTLTLLFKAIRLLITPISVCKLALGLRELI